MAEKHFASEEDFGQFMKDVQLVADLLLLPNKEMENVDLDGDGQIDGFQFELGNPLYTAQPLSSIRGFSLAINGEEIDPEKITFILRKNRINLKSVSTIPELWWRYGEIIHVFVEKPGGLKPGKYQVECSLTMTPAFYTFYPENTVLSTRTTMIVK
ncbi:MAG: DUF6379 domain-containing protein [Candidatus Bathyarchaeia archaeon]